jgi:hypothetical protein
MAQTTVAFILGDGYSGSTLLDLILGSHSRMVGLGEIDAESFDAFLDENQLCTCLLRARECHFWNGVLGRIRERTRVESFRLGAAGGDPEAVTRNTINLLEAVKDVSRAEVLVDSSKRLRRARLLAASGAIRPKVIHLVRDGRGVAYSYGKRGKPFREAVLQWQTVNAGIKNWLGGAGAPDNMGVRYEDLCARPAEVARDVCEFLGFGWEPPMMLFGNKTHHNVRGNTMRFRVKSSTIKLDETWKGELGEDDLRLFDELTNPATAYDAHTPTEVVR